MVRTFGSALSVVSLIACITTSNAASVQRRGVVPSKLPGSWVSKGCYVDVGRTLTGGGYDDDVAMTDESCIDYCSSAGFIYAGTEYSTQCYCGNTLATGGVPATSTDCSMSCSGNATEACGGPNRLNLFWSGTLGPQTSPGNGSWSFAGCYTEGTTGRTLANGATITGGSATMTVDLCTTSCQGSGYLLAGLEYSGECWCGNSIGGGATLAPEGISGCNMLCNGNFSEYCGGPSRLDVYNYKNEVSLPPWTTTGSSTAKTSTTSKTSSAVTSSSSKITISTSSTKSTSTSKASSTISTSKVSTTISTTVATVSLTLGLTPTVGAYTYIGCYTEGTNVRALGAAAFFDYTAMTIEECATDCAGYTYFGVEYGGECYCGNTLGAGSVLATAQSDCSFVCPGNQYEYCGAGNRLEMYQIGGSSSATGSKTTSTATETGTSKTSITTKVSTTTSTGPTSVPSGWTYQGCYVDGLTGRDLNYQQPDNTLNTVEACLATCSGLGYKVAGLEYGVQCFCDDFIYNGGTLAANQADCNVQCPGNTAEICGAGNRLSLYSIGTPQVYQAPAAQMSGLPINWAYKGCLQDNIASKEDPDEIISTFPYKIWDNSTFNDATACITQCQLFGYNAAGLEYGSQCFCGDVENIYVASAPGVSTDPDATQYYTRSATPQIVADSQCNSPCPGNPQYLCGSGNFLTYYAWNGSEPMYNFNFPTGDAAGEYSLLIGGVVVPLMTSQVVTGKVTFTEKYGSGEPNGTGAYELDLTEIDNWDLAWRTMTGMDTDVFCSAGLTLPDKAGRQITVGGWAGESNFGVRMYWPDGSAGVFGTNEWQEDPGVLSLQVPRWYPSAMVMANGSIMIIGGEIGSNDAEQPTLELLPATGVPDSTTVSGYSNTTVYLEWLDRTAPFNLYPFVAVVPSGIFVAYYNEALIMDEVTFETIKQLPNMPGAVNDPIGGRTYQLEGAMSLLPQYAPYTDNLGVLICGGSTSNGGYPIDNCISTYPEDENPTWTIERMPSRRVMPCMAGLPDGTFVIVNGAQHGVAGFGLAGDPNYNAVLYDPSKPVNSRMSVLANTTVARLYHSEAIVLLDGRIMISGSDPTGDYDQPAGEWPEEYRVEVFTPPYLLSGLARPTFTITNTDWEYGETVSITINIPSGSTANVKFSMLGSVVSTHGNAMGQRTIFPAFSCTSATTCTMTAPPNAHVAPPGWFMLFVLDGPTPAVGQFIRIGKDPANIGDWPAGIPAFEPLPGV